MITFMVGISFVHGQNIQTPEEAQTAYCSTSTICGAAPENFTLLLDFVREMANSIKTLWAEWDYIGKYINPNLYEGNIFVAPPKLTIVWRVAKNAEQKVKFVLASTAIFSSPVNIAWLKDFAGGTVLLTKGKVFLRDSKILEENEAILSTKKYELGLWWWWFTKINDANRAVMQAIIDKYITKWLLTRWTIPPGTTYDHVTALLTKTLSAAKSIIYFDSIGQFDEFSMLWTNDINIVFNTEAMQTVQKNYDCAKGFKNICNQNAISFKSIWQKLMASIKSSPYDTKTVFKDAVVRLGQIFSASKDEEEQKKFKERETMLLQATYGTSARRGKMIDIKIDAPGTKEAWAAIKKVAAWIWSLVPKKIGDKTKEIENIQKQEVPTVVIDTSDAGDKLFNQLLLSYVQDVFVNQTNDSSLATFAEVKTITPAFNVLWDQINTTKEGVLGSKDKEWSLIKSLWEACKAQCGWGWTCR